MRIEDIKQKVSIVEFIKFRKDLGFILKRDGKNIRAFIPLRDSQGNIRYEHGRPLKEESIIISRLNFKQGDPNSLHEVYFSTSEFDNDRRKSKSILDFVQEYVLKEQKLDFKKVTGVLYQYMDHPDFVHINNSSIDFISRSNTEKRKLPQKRIDYNYPSKNTFDYLNSRHISSETYSHPKFIGTYGHVNFPEEDIFNRPAFPLFNQNKKVQTVQWIDFTEKDKDHKGKFFAADILKDDSLYKSNYDKNHNTFCLIESPEKAMAHWELYSSDLKTSKINPRYYSACGNISLSNIEHILEDSKNDSINKFILAFDNDLKGREFTLFTFFKIHGIDLALKNNKDHTYKLAPSFDSQQKLQTLLTNQKIDFTQEGASFIIKVLPDEISQKLKTPHTEVHPSISKDFLDDLQSNSRLPFKPFHISRNNNQHVQ